MLLAKLAISLCAAALVACSGSSSPNTTPQNGSGEGSSVESDEDAKLRKAQLSSCGPLCERLVDCSVEDLRTNKTEQEIAEMQLDQLVPRAVEECNTECGSKTLSPRQIRVVQECVNGPEACDEYLQCLDKAQRGGG